MLDGISSIRIYPDSHAHRFWANRAATRALRSTTADGFGVRQMPTLHEARSLSSHLYATAGYEVAAVQQLMAHTDPDMTRAYQKGHARKVIHVHMVLPYHVPKHDDAVREERAVYRVGASLQLQEIFPENPLTENLAAA